MKKFFPFILVCSLSFLLVGCGTQKAVEACPISSWSFSCWAIPVSWTIDHSDFSGAVTSVLQALKNNDFQKLSTFVWSHGLRFTPYGHVNTETDIVLDTQIVASAPTINRSYVRGIYDGKWDPIDLSIGQYFEKFVNDADYAKAPQLLYNQNIQRGNTINNVAEIYTGKQWVEFYFSGFDPQYQGMDRKSLTLIFDNVGGQRQVIGIVHQQRTI